MYKSKHKSGFTLIELAVVLVIVGLLVGGILQGMELINSAKRNKAIVQVSKYLTAINTFQLKYNALPGDMRNASTMISSLVSNGDGDKIITYNSNEMLYFWQHLSVSNIIEGSYDGINTIDTSKDCSAGYICSIPNKNVPAAPYDYSIWQTFYPWSTFPLKKNLLALSRTGIWHYAVITTEDAKIIDEKLDDGYPTSGLVMFTNLGATPNCVTTLGGVVVYNLQYTSGVACWLVFGYN